MQKFDTPIEQASTRSLEALQAFNLGWKEADPADAAALFQRAIGLDPNFAMAYANLGNSYAALGETSLAEENIRKAYELRERVSQSEKFFIEFNYNWFATGDLERVRQTFKLWAQTYPRDSAARGMGSWIYAALGKYDKALEEVREARRLDPTLSVVYGVLVHRYLLLNRLDEARTTAEEAQAKNLDSPVLRFGLYRLAFLQNDAEAMAEQVSWSAGKPRLEDVLLANEADTAAYSGQLGKAGCFPIGQSLPPSGPKPRRRRPVTRLMPRCGKPSLAMPPKPASGPGLRSGFRGAGMCDVERGWLWSLAATGPWDQAQIETLVDDLARRFPEDTVVQFNYLPTIRAQLALNRNDPLKGIQTLQSAVPYDLGIPPSWAFSHALYPVYLRGQAYLALHKGSEAAAEFQKILDHRGVVFNEPIGALAHLGLARAYSLTGDTAKARTKYQDFLALWKDADPDLPVLKQARGDYAKLQ